MNNFSYEKFLQDKVNDEHTLMHLMQEEAASQKERNTKLLKDMAILRKSENDLKLRNKQMEEKMSELQIQIKRQKEVRNIKAKQVTSKRIKQQKCDVIDPKQIFKDYLDNTFPTYKGMIKKILKAIYIIEDLDKKQPLQKIQFYKAVFDNLVKRFVDWLFPKKRQAEKSKTIAQNLIQNWKDKEKINKNEQQKSNFILLRQAEYVKKIENLQSQLLMLKSSKFMLQNRMKTYQRALQSKGAQFVVHLKKMLQKAEDYQPQSQQKVHQILELFTNLAQNTTNMYNMQSIVKVEERQQVKSILNDIPLVLAEKGFSKRKAPPIVKKNIFGYYQEPQFASNFTLPVSTKHIINSKYCQTLPEDLCILTLHPVIMVTLIDGNIKSQRTRHSLQYYVKIRVNEQRSTISTTKESLEPIWNEPFLLKDYDFPFISVQLMHKSKGLRDYSIGSGKFSASSLEEKIVNLRKEKEFHGRVRFSLSYPKGNIYQFKITSVMLEIPSNKSILKEQVAIHFPFNEAIQLEFNLPEKIVFTQRSAIILQNCQQKLKVQLLKQCRKQEVNLTEFIGKQGNKQVIVDMGQQWRVIIQGEVYLLICQDQQPEKISQQLLQGGIGKYFSVRAPPPIVTVSYDNVILNSNIKFPLVFNLSASDNKIKVIKQLYNHELQQQIHQNFINADGCLKMSQFIKAPSKIYKLFIETLEGQEVILKHQSHLFQRLLKQIHLQVSYKQQEIQEISNARKRNPKGKEALFKEFTIQSKELMLNYFKVFTRHFKRIGFVKFKLGYTIYDNQLMQKNSSVSNIKESKKIEPLREGIIFIELELSEAHLQTHSKSSSYSCKINEIVSKSIKGNHPQWQETTTLSFQFTQKFQLQFTYQIMEQDKSIYQGKATINENVMRLGELIINLSQDGLNCLHFSKICVPKQIYRLNIQEILAQIEDNADWIGKIDPYIVLYSKNKQILKTEYLDNIGSHPIWKDINQELVVGGERSQKDEEEILYCKLYDYDLIGKNDSLGQVSITSKLNPELIKSNKSEILYGNLIKDNRICGSIKIKGTFEKITQQPIQFLQSSKNKINKKDFVYRLVIYKLTFSNLQDFQGDKGWINTLQQQEKPVEFVFDKSKLNRFSYIKWGINPKNWLFQIKHQHKTFFKKIVQSVGKFEISINQQEFIMNQTEIKHQNGSIIGYCSWFVQIQSKVKYAAVTSHTCCQNDITLKTDLNDQITLLTHNKGQNYSPHFVFYEQELNFYKITSQNTYLIQLKQVNKGIFQLNWKQSKHKCSISSIKIDFDCIHETLIQQSSNKLKIEHDRQFKHLKYIHWQPYKYETENEFRFILELKQSQQKFNIIQKSSNVFNEYLILRSQNIPIIFNQTNIPSKITINDNKNVEQTIIINQSTTQQFIPNKGALYYKLQDYNLKSVLELHFSYLYLKIKDAGKLIGKSNIIVRITNSLSLKVFQCQPILQDNYFLFENISLLIAQPPHQSTFFFQAEVLASQAKNQNRVSLSNFKFGFKLQNNKEQYRFAQNEHCIVHTFFSCCLIQRKYQAPPLKDNTIYGMSFIQLQQLQYEGSQDSSHQLIYADLCLLNQFQKIVLERKKDTHTYQAFLDSSFYIQKDASVKLNIYEQGIITKNIIGQSNLIFSELNKSKQIVNIHQSVIKKSIAVGKVKLKYKNMKEVDFVDVDIYSYLSKSNATLAAELQQFGSNKDKYQRIDLTSKGNVARLESEDSFIIVKDPREYQIAVSQKQSNRLLGEFKLCHQLEKFGEKITVLQPLRTEHDSLNGLLIIDYQNKKSNSTTFSEIKDKSMQIIQNKPTIQSIQIVQIMIHDLIFKNQQSRTNDTFSVRLQSKSRSNWAKPIKLDKMNKILFKFTIYNNQSCQIYLMDKNETIGISKLTIPYYDNEQRVLQFNKDSICTGICLLTTKYLRNKEDLNVMREIVSAQSTNLIDTEYFVKMTPYMEIEYGNGWPIYLSDLGIGKQHIFWQLNLLTRDPLKVVVKDKDMFFDDLIGSVTIPSIKDKQTQDETQEYSLIAEQGQNRKGGNGNLIIETSPTLNTELNQQQIPRISIKQSNYYLLKLGGISPNLQQIMKKAQRLEISLGNQLNRTLLLKQHYNKDMSFYLFNRDLEVELDTTFLNLKLSELRIFVNLFSENIIIYQQQISKEKRIQANKIQLFSIYNILPVKRQIYALDKIYLWISVKVSNNIQVVAVSDEKYQILNILSSSKRLIIAQPYQIFDIRKPLWLLVKQNNKELCKYYLDFKQQMKDTNSATINSPLRNSKQKQIGYIYATISKYNSQGSEGLDSQRKINIGKSRTKWMILCICQANLTKDVQFFSKMDPYCKFYIFSKSNDGDIMTTSVQQNIGMHPIWNQSFFLRLSDSKDEHLNLAVMDSEVTIDRPIGEGKKSINQLLKTQLQQIEVFYKQNQSSGKVIVKVRVTEKYIIFRDKMDVNQNQSQVYLIHQQNEAKKQGEKIILGKCYPIDESKPIKLKTDNQIQSFTFNQMKQQQRKGVQFKQKFIKLTYELFQ